MSETKAIVIAGFGGQGLLLAGKIIALASMYQGKHTTWIPSYGPEMRGGTASCTVVVSDEPIGSPIVKHPDIAIVMNQPSFDKYSKLIAEDGYLIVNTSLVEMPSGYYPYTCVPATEKARELGNERVANMIMLGALKPTLLPVEFVLRALSECFTDKKLVELNLKAFVTTY